MSLEYPEDLKYLDSHEYVRLEGEIATIGISAFAIDQLGDIVYLELPGDGDALTKGERFGNVESVKAVEELISPISGTVVEVNKAMEDSPEGLAEDPYGEGWLVKIRTSSPDDLQDALSAKEYQEQVEGH
jgi:glycine cleavage system H protein